MNRGKFLIFAPFEIWWFPPRFYDPLLNLEVHYTIKMPENQVSFGRFSLWLAVGSRELVSGGGPVRGGTKCCGA